DTRISQFKFEGYKRALQEYGVELNQDYIVNVDYSYDSGIVAVKQLMELSNRPSSVFVASDEMALGVIPGAQDLSNKVPEDLDVFGFNHTRLAKMVRPTLSTIVQPMYDTGAVSMPLLTKYMNKESVEEKKVILPHRIIERDSTNTK